MSENKKSLIAELIGLGSLFFKLGTIAFGGPVAHIAMMRDEVVQKRKWMTESRFLDLIGITNLIPGPNSTEMSMQCGHDRAGVPGMFVSGFFFIFPAAVLTMIMAMIYVEYGEIPDVRFLLDGIKAAVFAIIFSALWKLSKKALKNTTLYVFAAIAIVASFFGGNEILVILGTGVLGLLYHAVGGKTFLFSVTPWSIFLFSKISEEAFSLERMFWSFLKIGAILFGSGYVLIAYIEGEFVEQLGWLTESQLLEAIAIGQLTPGPVLTTATFIGYLLGGVKGGILATIGIFLPSFLYVILIHPLIDRIRNNRFFSSFLDAVNVGALAVMAFVTFKIGIQVWVDYKLLGITIICTLLFFSIKKMSSIHVVLVGALLGWLSNMLF